MEANGFVEWTVQRQEDRPNMPCASVAYDITEATVMIAPISSP